MEGDDIEAIEYEREKKQKNLVIILTRLNKLQTSWTLEEVNATITACKNAANCGLDNEQTALTGLNGPFLVAELLRAVEEYKRAEAKRRVYAKANQKKEMLIKRLKKRRDLSRSLKAARRQILKLQEIKFEEATELPNLNESMNEVKEISDALKNAEEALIVANKADRDLPTNDKDYVEEINKNFSKCVTVAIGKVALLEKALSKEIHSRRESERNAYNMKMMDIDAKREKEEAEEKARQEDLKRIRDTAAKAIEERKKSQSELENMESERIRLHKEENELERELQKVIDAGGDRVDMEQMLILFKDKKLRAEVESKQKAEEYALKAKLAEEAAKKEQEEIKSKMREEERVEQEKREKELQIQNAKLEKMEFQRSAVDRSKLIELKKQDQIIKLTQERALIDEGDDDTEEETRLREEARGLINNYFGNVFTAIKNNDLKMVRSFLLVNGTKMIHAHSKGITDGGRTLMHSACWYGCPDLVEYLIKLGADVNCIDSSALKLTPLMEATRGGRIKCIELLISSGANIMLQDASGDTAAHIASRNNRGGLIVVIINTAERKEARSSNGFLEIQNFKKKTCFDVTRSIIVQRIIKNAKISELQRIANRKGALLRMKKAAVKAKVIGNQAGEKALSKVKAKRRRYAPKKKKAALSPISRK